MRAPAFWWRPPGAPGWQARLLAPAAALWAAGAAWRRRRARAARNPVPVICVGNLTAGGGGKTPMVAALARRLAAEGQAMHLLAHGYGGRPGEPRRVDLARDSFREVGDEALVLAALAPTWVARDRAAGIAAAAAAGAGVVVMDDGFQDPAVTPDLAILMVDAALAFGNGRLIPAGPLREPVAAGLARADLTVLVGTGPEQAAARRLWPPLGEALPARLVPVETGLRLAGEPVVAFAGIARPERFFATLRAVGAEVLAAVPFPDHHPYRPAILRRLLARARGAGAMLVTTEKDAARLPPAFRREVVVLQVRLEPDDWGPIDGLLSRLPTARGD